MIQSITLKNYRSYSESSFEFSSGVTIIIGPNASGKTNLLEAVYVLSQGSAFRSGDKDLISSDSPWARIEGYVDGEKRVVKLEQNEPRTKKTIELNDTAKARLSFNETIPIVLFEPDDSRIIGGSPERRRAYLDTVLSSVSPSYKKSLSSYKRALKQRNNLLKSSQSTGSLFAWNMVLARHADELVKERLEFIEYINQALPEIYSTLAGTSCELLVSYESIVHGGNYLQTYLNRLERSFSLDKERGYTSIGPHRDDFKIELNQKNSGVFASRGEGRTITLALKIIELRIIEQRRGTKPILLLDDVFSELDGARRRMLTDSIRDHQAVITTTDADVVEKKFVQLAQLISL
jgi:DNA replication and repair protein RecF